MNNTLILRLMQRMGLISINFFVAGPPMWRKQGDTGMEKVLGFGGFFFRAHDQAGLRRWYAQHLGVDETPTDYDTPGWRQNGGTTVFEPFAADTDYFDRPQQQWMINFRVRDLSAMVAQLRNANIDVTVDPEPYPNGTFARLNDPEGNPIQLWQPSGPSLGDEETP